MAIPADATPFERVLDPVDEEWFGIAFGQDGSAKAVLAEGESVASFTLERTQEAIDAGLVVKQGDGFPAPFLADNVVQFWLAIDPAKRGNAIFDRVGVKLALELTFTTNATPPRTKQRTITITVRQR